MFHLSPPKVKNRRAERIRAAFKYAVRRSEVRGDFAHQAAQAAGIKQNKAERVRAAFKHAVRWSVMRCST